MSYCNLGEKATVTYTNKSGVVSQFITKNTPIDIECSDQQRTGKYIFTLNDYGYTTDCNSSGQLFTETVIADSYQVTSTTNSGQYASCPWYEVAFYIDADLVTSFKKTMRYSVSQVSNPNYSPGGKVLIIRNAQGTKLLEQQVKDCNYKVACGEECPGGHHKCKTNKYPGYCCIPCQQTASRINNLASKARCCHG